MTPLDPDTELPDEDMRGFIGLPDYCAEVTLVECLLDPLPAGVESAKTELRPPFDRRDRFYRQQRVDDKPQSIRETWVNWVKEAEGRPEPPPVLSVTVYSHRVDWHTEIPMILVYDNYQRCYLLVS